MPDPELVVCACGGLEAARGTAAVPAVRDLALRRRRSKIPWMYAVYHAARPEPAHMDDNGHRAWDAVAERETYRVR